MANYNFYQSGNQLVVELDVSGNDAEPRLMTYLLPSMDYANDKIRLFEAGEYKQAFLFSDIGTIDGSEPDNIGVAVEYLKALLGNFNSGGDTPSLGYKEYVAFILQSDTSDPVLQEIKNDTGAILIAQRLSQGVYVISSDIPVFTENKTIPTDNNAEMIITNMLVTSDGILNGSYIYYRGSESEMSVRTFDASASYSDSVLDGSQIIRIQIFD